MFALVKSLKFNYKPAQQIVIIALVQAARPVQPALADSK